jgi:hypothetical protein
MVAAPPSKRLAIRQFGAGQSCRQADVGEECYRVEIPTEGHVARGGTRPLPARRVLIRSAHRARPRGL